MIWKFLGILAIHFACWALVFSVIGPDLVSSISDWRWALFGALVCGLVQPWRRMKAPL
jgi:hypothetical protein